MVSSSPNPLWFWGIDASYEKRPRTYTRQMLLDPDRKIQAGEPAKERFQISRREGSDGHSEGKGERRGRPKVTAPLHESTRYESWVLVDPQRNQPSRRQPLFPQGRHGGGHGALERDRGGVTTIPARLGPLTSTSAPMSSPRIARTKGRRGTHIGTGTTNGADHLKVEGPSTLQIRKQLPDFNTHKPPTRIYADCDSEIARFTGLALHLDKACVRVGEFIKTQRPLMFLEEDFNDF